MRGLEAGLEELPSGEGEAVHLARDVDEEHLHDVVVDLRAPERYSFDDSLEILGGSGGWSGGAISRTVSVQEVCGVLL